MRRNYVIGKPSVLFLPIAIGIRNSYFIIGTTLLNLPFSYSLLPSLTFYKDIREAFALRAFVLAHQLLRNILPFSSPLLTSLTL